MGLRHFRRPSRLTQLWILCICREIQLDPMEFKHLLRHSRPNSTLITLHFWNNSIGDNGTQALAEALRTNSSLTTLNLAGNSIGNNGAVALSEVLKTNSTLTTLELQNNSIGVMGAQRLQMVSQVIGCIVGQW
jgi:hypothetical protein